MERDELIYTVSKESKGERKLIDCKCRQGCEISYSNTKQKKQSNVLRNYCIKRAPGTKRLPILNWISIYIDPKHNFIGPKKLCLYIVFYLKN